MKAKRQSFWAIALAALTGLVLGLAAPSGVRAGSSPRPPGAMPGDGGPSSVIFPPQTIGVRFDHARHMALGATCATCHDKAKTSRNSADSLLPAGTRCDACHGTNHRGKSVVAGADALGACALCHVGYRSEDEQRVLRTQIPPPHLRFDHAVHAARHIDCAACHGDVASLTQATFDQLPRMRGCFSCHTSDTAKRGVASRACPTCHLTEKSTLLVTTFPEGRLEPPAWLHDSEHGPDWLERHKRIAGDESRFCSSCHTEHFCTGCHDGRVRPRQIHPNDFLSMHAVAARQNSPNCTSCHQQQSFCLSCHQRAGVTLNGPVGNITQRGRFHPPPSIWTDAPRGSGHHAWEAER
ncbi:MAG TPA: cytochrome c3 family protein, partial [Polyangiaceae bacterium]|nr:cytochrome c3 family protein [Polyangiaceae bacterium]